MATEEKTKATKKTSKVKAKSSTKAKVGKTVAGKAAGHQAKATAKSGDLPERILIIVESPAKAKTIEKYLGPRYSVFASMGHLIDLPKSRLGIDVDGDFEPEYLTIRGKATLLKELKKAAAKSTRILLASDNDREGEAISYHIQRSLTGKNATVNGNQHIARIVFNEITPNAIRESVKELREIDESKVNAQKARRVLDRLVGYNLSPLLWKKVKNGLSAGRVQSVALRLICEREKEVESFFPEEYWTIDATFRKGRSSFDAELLEFEGTKPVLKNEQSAAAIIKALEGKEAIVGESTETEKTLKPKPPFTTSKLQQASATRLGFTSRKTMQIAQQLYEGIEIDSSRLGLITYMRTDSTRVAQTAIAEARAFIAKNFPAELPHDPIEYAVQSKAQDAHEAIRPTMVDKTPAEIGSFLNRDQLKLYTLIWEQFVASQMTNAKSRTVSTVIEIGKALFKVSSTKIVEPGFQRVLGLSMPRSEKTGNWIPELHKGEILKVAAILSHQHFTQGPSRYSDASIVKILEERGIGRPSTYASIISVLLDRYYVVRENRQFKPTTLGRMINDILVESFPDVIDANFTAEMENRLDEVEDAKAPWVEMIRSFWGPFKKHVDEVMDTLESFKGTFDERTNITCEKCGKPMVKKLGRFGFFIACSGFPECRNTKSIPLARCPKPGCGGDIIARRKAKGRGREFYGCSNFPECDFISYHKPLQASCPKCGWFLVEKYDKKDGAQKLCINPECDYLHAQEEPHG